MKKIGIMTTGGDCSGLNAAIMRLVAGGMKRGHQMFGIVDGTDGLTSTPPGIIPLTAGSLPAEDSRIAGSFLRNGNANTKNFETAAKTGKQKEFRGQIKKSLEKMGLDALVIIGGNGSLSLTHTHREIYGDVQLVCIPKTIDMDIPLTDRTLGFDTAMQQLAAYCDQLMLTARSHHRWFVVQAMGRDTGHLSLHAGVACGADAILIPEIKFKAESLAKHLKKSPRDYGIIIAAEGIRLRGHSGAAADMIARELKKRGFAVRAAFPEHIQRAGDTTAADRILASRFSEAALDAVDNNETYVMTSLLDGAVKTVPLAEMFAAGELTEDAKIPDMMVSNSFVPPDHPLLSAAVSQGAYVGEIK
ncbi:MAG: 6-phosphofructokinase [Alphaproteobacteria bacterium]|nr:6-phosphofructokinase [Alphaproteobacteria bacterium]